MSELDQIRAWARHEADHYASMAENRDIRCGADVRLIDHCKRRAEWFSELDLMLERREYLAFKPPSPNALPQPLEDVG